VPRDQSTTKQAEFLAALTNARKEAGLTQAVLAARLGRPQSFVSKYESGERRLDVLEFLEVARVVGFNPARFLDNLEQP
jgi:transcriptional regulator with XRE-family HTH domain